MTHTPPTEPALDLEALKATAKAATPGPWQNGIDDLQGVVAPHQPGLGNVICIPPLKRMYSSLEKWDDNATFIATFDPPTALALIAKIEELQALSRLPEGGGEGSAGAESMCDEALPIASEPPLSAEEVDRGAQGRVVDALWPILGGNHMSADAWTEIGEAVAGALAPPISHVENGGKYRCTRCGRDEIDGRANGCTRGPCPMEFVG